MRLDALGRCQVGVGEGEAGDHVRRRGVEDSGTSSCSSELWLCALGGCAVPAATYKRVSHNAAVPVPRMGDGL
jgi:hypothetical protein